MPPTQTKQDQTSRKLCFVTVGATAPFAPLVRAVLRPSFQAALTHHGYTDLRIQHGADADNATLLANARENMAPSIALEGFAFRPDGLARDFREASGGVVVCHAGTGTILEGLRLSASMIVVANPALLDNHQAELASQLARQGYVVHGELVGADGRAGDDAAAAQLAGALAEAERLRGRLEGGAPLNGAASGVGGGLVAVLDEEMGFAGLD